MKHLRLKSARSWRLPLQGWGRLSGKLPEAERGPGSQGSRGGDDPQHCGLGVGGAVDAVPGRAAERGGDDPQCCGLGGRVLWMLSQGGQQRWSGGAGVPHGADGG